VKARGLAVAGLVLLAATAAAAKPFPWGAHDKPPSIAGLTIGDTEQHALDVLGPPDDVTTGAMGELLEYPAKGLELTVAKNGIVAIKLSTPEAGAIGELRVGDIARDVIVKWGAPENGQGRLAQYGTDDWMVIVRLADKEAKIVDMTLADKRARPVPPPDSGNLNVFKTQ
jgi:hypothetical protein